MPIDITLIIPVHNEEAILKKNVRAVYDYMKRCPFVERFEIILSCNGCTDASEKISRELSKTYPHVRHISIDGRGLGSAIREAVHRASYGTMMFYAADLPFGLSVIGDSIRAAVKNNNAVVIGSKGHRDSVVKRSFTRTVFSNAISTLNNRFFGLGVKDTQGSILFYREPFNELMDSPGAFLQTQILIYSKLAGFELVEIPVELKKEERKTRFRLASDGLKYISSVFKERKKLSRAGLRPLNQRG